MKLPDRAQAGRSLMMTAFAAVSAVCMMLASCATRPNPSSARAPTTRHHVANDFLGTNWAQPLPGGVPTTVAGAQAGAGFTVVVPNDAPVASQANLTQTWVDRPAKQVALVFDQGKVDIEMWPWPSWYPDPATKFKQFITSTPATAALSQVNGQPALVIQPNTDYTKSNRAWVEFELNGIDVNISSDTYGTDVLLRVASSMQVATPTPTPTPTSGV